MFDRPALEELFDYTDFTWAAYSRTLSTLPPDAFARPIEGSGWRSLRHALFHVALAWDNWAYEHAGLATPEEIIEQDIATLDDLQPHRERVRVLLRRALDGTNDASLADRTLPMWEDTPAAYDVSLADVLIHILLHERGHHGDISTLFSQLGAEPPNVDYLVYGWFKNRRQRRDA